MADLVLHRGAVHVGFEDLRALPDPMALGAHHKPVRHDVLVETIRAEVAARAMVVTREQFGLGHKGAALFAVMDLVQAQTSLVPSGESTGISLGFRSANDQSLAIRMVAGARVFVCDNLVLSGETFAISRLHTTGLDLVAAVRTGFDRFLTQGQKLADQMTVLEFTALAETEAKALIFDLFSQAVLPMKLFDDVDRFYFHPTDETPDCQPRTKWGLHNAITRSIKALRPVPAFETTVRVGKFFGLGRNGETIPAETVEAAAN